MATIPPPIQSPRPSKGAISNAIQQQQHQSTSPLFSLPPHSILLALYPRGDVYACKQARSKDGKQISYHHNIAQSVFSSTFPHFSAPHPYSCCPLPPPLPISAYSYECLQQWYQANSSNTPAIALNEWREHSLFHSYDPSFRPSSGSESDLCHRTKLPLPSRDIMTSNRFVIQFQSCTSNGKS